MHWTVLALALEVLSSGIMASDMGPGANAPVRPFRLNQVRLGDGILQEKRDLVKNFLFEYDERRFLILFNNQAGRANPQNISVPGGWEDGGLLSGHWAGHYMTALSQAYADQGEDKYKSKLDWMVNELAACQRAITSRMEGNSTTAHGAQSPVSRVKGKFGRALQLNGTGRSEYVTMPQEVVNQLKDFTIAAWVNLASSDTYMRLFDFGSDTKVYMYLSPNVPGASGSAPRFAITTDGSTKEEQINGKTAVPLNQWTHIAVTLSGTTGTLYINGELSGTNKDMTLNPTSLSGANNRWIGRSQFGDPFLNATVDEFHIFDRALTSDEVQSMQESASGSTKGGNIAWYRFDEEGGSSALDSSPNNRAAGIVGEDDGGDGNWVPTYPGYLGALPEDVVLRLGPPRWAVYGGDPNTNTWSPWYTQHKIMRGLLDAYYNTNNSQALDVVTKMADWAYNALTIGDKNQPGYKGNLTREDLNYMWDLYIAGEYGGANEVFAELYDLTDDERYLTAAKAFDNRASLFGASVQDHDILVVTPENNPGPRRADRLHANTHVPQFIGYMRIYEQSWEKDYLNAAKNFWGWVVPHRSFSHGGTGGNYPGANQNSELFQNRDNIANAIASNGAETCTTYNMLKLGRNLFLHEHDAKYMDHYERGLFNMIAGSRSETASSTDPMLTYFQPLTPGSARDYGNTGTCCGGSGLESHTKYQETVYLRSADNSILWVNLYIPSTLTWEEKNLKLQQETMFPREDSVKLKVRGTGPLKINLRVPSWTRGFSVSVNGQKLDNSTVSQGPGSYMAISRDWQEGDVVDLQMPFNVSIERALDRPDTQSIMWGPVLLQLIGAPTTSSGYHELSLYKYMKLDGDYTRAAMRRTTTANGDSIFTMAGGNLTARPYYIGDAQAASAYFRRVEPDVVFGSVKAGVPNRKQNKGLPDYNVPVQGVVSPGADGPTFLDLVWDKAPFKSQADFEGWVAKVARSFVCAGVYSKEEQEQIVKAAHDAEEDITV